MSKEEKDTKKYKKLYQYNYKINYAFYKEDKEKYKIDQNQYYYFSLKENKY